MIISVDLASTVPTVALRDPDDLTSLKVLVNADTASVDELAGALAPVGTLDEQGNALLGIEHLKSLAQDRARDPDWLASFDGMVAYARSKGWLTPDGKSLQAHCEWQRPPG
jgi:hypothetical protein